MAAEIFHVAYSYNRQILLSPEKNYTYTTCKILFSRPSSDNASLEVKGRSFFKKTKLTLLETVSVQGI